ncbi:MAG: RsmG family class I SAM-dependent methyltransferase [Actinomycetota bacterium]
MQQFIGLEPILLEAQRVGALTEVPIAEIIEHALWFSRAIPGAAERIVDLGSGAGVPGLIVALDRPNLEVVLVDRRSGRTDSLIRAVSALQIQTRVKVVCAEINSLIDDPNWAKSFDAAISRGLGPVAETLIMSKKLTKDGGVVVVSEPPVEAGSRWNQTQVESLGLSGPDRVGAVAVFHVKHLGQ